MRLGGAGGTGSNKPDVHHVGDGCSAADERANNRHDTTLQSEPWCIEPRFSGRPDDPEHDHIDVVEPRKLEFEHISSEHVLIIDGIDITIDRARNDVDAEPRHTAGRNGAWFTRNIGLWYVDASVLERSIKRSDSAAEFSRVADHNSVLAASDVYEPDHSDNDTRSDDDDDSVNDADRAAALFTALTRRESSREVEQLPGLFLPRRCREAVQ